MLLLLVCFDFVILCIVVAVVAVSFVKRGEESKRCTLPPITDFFPGSPEDDGLILSSY